MILATASAPSSHREVEFGLESWKRWMCRNCGWIYDERVGDPTSGITPGTRWDDVPDNWCCPDCGAAKSEFEMIEI